MCVNYSDINANTEKSAYPLPRIHEVWTILIKNSIVCFYRFYNEIPLVKGLLEKRFKTVIVI